MIDPLTGIVHMHGLELLGIQKDPLKDPVNDPLKDAVKAFGDVRSPWECPKSVKAFGNVVLISRK